MMREEGDGLATFCKSEEEGEETAADVVAGEVMLAVRRWPVRLWCCSLSLKVIVCPLAQTKTRSDKNTLRQKDAQTKRCSDKNTLRQKDAQTKRCSDKNTLRQKDAQTKRCSDKKMLRHTGTGKQTDARMAHAHAHTLTHQRSLS